MSDCEVLLSALRFARAKAVAFHMIEHNKEDLRDLTNMS